MQAMIGSAGDFGANFESKNSPSEDTHTIYSDESEVRTRDDWQPLHNAQMASTDGGSSNESTKLYPMPKIFSARKVKKEVRTSSYSDGVESFNCDMKRFEHIKRIIHSANTHEGYRQCLLDQSLDNMITIPVSYLKVVSEMM
jgi:hypothetical protein